MGLNLASDRLDVMFFAIKRTAENNRKGQEPTGLFDGAVKEKSDVPSTQTHLGGSEFVARV